MAKNGNSEETYSLIFASLKHPIRRRILRMLRDDQMTFSQILEALSINSGHLSYHLESLGDLITHSPNGKYRLSSLGTAADRLMSGVEEHNPPPHAFLNRKSKVDTTIKMFSIVLAAILLWSSLYSIGLSTRTEGLFVRVPKTDEKIPFALAPGQTYQYNITMVYEGLPIVSTEPKQLRIVTNDEPISTLSEWRSYFLRVELEFNQTSNITMTIRNPSSAMISESRLGGMAIISIGPNVYLTQPGTYQIEIHNNLSDQLQGKIAFEVLWEELQKPLFYYGLAGIAAALLYPIVVLVGWYLREKTGPIAQV